MQDTDFTGEGVIGGILERIRATARVELVYGEERKIGDKTIIPIAAVAYTFGGGAGGGTAPDHHGGNGSSEMSVGGGGGGGGMVRVLPVGVLEIEDDQTRVVPVIDWSRVITTGLTVFGVWMIFRTIFRRK
ncbi:MAG TPA: spore germination protein GerW family protein [Dehalococcoidia bacterium]|nr:spore germination protein GerW family protein [Dehalococcoidia bacterium]